MKLKLSFKRLVTIAAKLFERISKTHVKELKKKEKKIMDRQTEKMRYRTDIKVIIFFLYMSFVA